MIKELLCNIFCGLNAEELWDGRRKTDRLLNEVGYVYSCVYSKCYLTYNWFCDHGFVYKEYGEYFLKVDFEINAFAY